jgi:hypothetical protein
MMRTAAIWVFGLLAAALFGGIISAWLIHDLGVVGMLAGMFAFACLRLWLAAPSIRR